MNPVKNPLYVPPENAKERGDYALDIYTGCPHNCPYCYAPDALSVSREKFRAHAQSVRALWGGGGKTAP